VTDSPLVLVVDDDEDCRASLREALEHAQFNVDDVQSGRAALDRLLRRDAPEPSVILLDLEMPIMTGTEFIMVVESYYRLSRIPIVVVTGREPLLAGHRFGVSAVVRKPLDPDLLARTINNLIGR
jgi:CheY-like chemotaxis protein